MLKSLWYALELSSKITITAYTVDNWNAGQTRHTGPCAMCHGHAAGVDHTSTITAQTGVVAFIRSLALKRFK